MIAFGTGGFRGIVDQDFTLDNVSKIANGIGQYLLDHHLSKVAIGYDFRYYSASSCSLMTGILVTYGIEVVQTSGPCPTPVVMYLVTAYECDFGIMVTASHNPSNYNGIKVFDRDGSDAALELTSALEEYINDDQHPPHKATPGLIHQVNAIHGYLEYVKGFIQLNKYYSLKVLFDPLHGTSILTIPPLLKDTEFKMINGTIDSSFFGVLPNPIYANIIKNKPLLLEEKYDLCISTDSDGDRLGVLDEQGHFIDNNAILAMIYYYLVKYRQEKGGIVKNLATSNLIDALAEKLGYPCYTVDVGFKNISHAMAQYDLLLGGESSGGLTIRNYIKGKDATLSSLLLIEMVSVLGKPISAILTEVQAFADYHASSVERGLEYSDRDKIMAFVNRNGFEAVIPGVTRHEISGQNDNNVKYFLAHDGWVLLRFSGTEKVLRLIGETPVVSFTNQILDTITKELLHLV